MTSGGFSALDGVLEFVVLFNASRVMSLGLCILIAAVCLFVGQVAMKNKVARQIDFGMRHHRIKIEIDGRPIESTAALYSVICADSYPQK